jgi:hypothetical protein
VVCFHTSLAELSFNQQYTDSIHPMCRNSCRLFRRSRPNSRPWVTFRYKFPPPPLLCGFVSLTPIGCLRVLIQYIRS